MFPDDIFQSAGSLLEALRAKNWRLATAESCTGGLIAAAMTEVPGSSDVFDRGFVTYSNAAKIAMLDVPEDVLNRYGAVSVEVAAAMARGALKNSAADIAVSVTGVAGPGGGSVEKPVGMVCFAVERRTGEVKTDIQNFGDIGRQEVRLQSVRRALVLLGDAI